MDRARPTPSRGNRTPTPRPHLYVSALWTLEKSHFSGKSHRPCPVVALQSSGALAQPQMIPIGESGSVPNVPMGQSVSMSSMSVGQSGGAPVGQTFLQPTTMVPQVSPSVPQLYLQVKRAIILICL